MKLWAGRFTKSTDESVEAYTASIDFDRTLVEYDIKGSLAHAAMLGRCGIVSDEESKELRRGLVAVLDRVRKGSVQFSVKDEDVHMGVERLLKEEIGPLAGKLHTARSRNDQVGLDMRLYLRERSLEIIGLLLGLTDTLLEQAKKNLDTILPGYTHLQRAQPVLFAHHLGAYLGMFERDLARLRDGWPRINNLPLGAGALAGTTFPIDRASVAAELAFDSVYGNSMDAVSDRDFVVEFLSTAALSMAHFSRLSEELIIWSSTEFAFVELDDAFCTGSSIMPQKKNPDVAELARGKTGRVYGSLFGMLTILKGLPLTYNRDLQEDKEGMFDAVETLAGTAALFAPMIATMKVKREEMREAAAKDYSNATDLADYLAKKGMPFREAHAVAGRAVLYGIDKGKFLGELTLEEYRTLSDLIGNDIYQAIEISTVVNARTSLGGTGRSQVERQLAKVAVKLEDHRRWQAETAKRIGQRG